MLQASLPKPPFTFDTLKGIHRYIFQDVYEWAGKPRTIGLAKREFDEPGSRASGFVDSDQIEVEAQRIFSGLAMRGFLAGLPPDKFAKRAATLLAEINQLHAFREGNGRSQRLLLEAVAENAGHTLAFEVITRERMVAISIAASKGDITGFERMMAEIMDPRRVEAMKKALGFLKQSDRVPWNDLYVATTVAGQSYEGVLVGKAAPDFMMRVRQRMQDWIAIGDHDDLDPNAKSGDNLSFVAKKFDN